MSYFDRYQDRIPQSFDEIDGVFMERHDIGEDEKVTQVGAVIKGISVTGGEAIGGDPVAVVRLLLVAAAPGGQVVEVESQPLAVPLPLAEGLGRSLLEVADGLKGEDA